MHPPYVTVGDVMHPAVITLRENMLLRLAVRLFVNTGLHAAPVMEAETARSSGYKRTQRTRMYRNQPIADIAYVRLTATRRAQLMRELPTIRHSRGPRLLGNLTVVACVAGQARGCHHSDGHALPGQSRCRNGPLPLAGAPPCAHRCESLFYAPRVHSDIPSSARSCNDHPTLMSVFCVCASQLS